MKRKCNHKFISKRFSHLEKKCNLILHQQNKCYIYLVLKNNYLDKFSRFIYLFSFLHGFKILKFN